MTTDKPIILIIGTPDDPPSVDMQKRIEARGGRTAMFDTTRFPVETRLTYTPDSPVKGYFQESASSTKIPLTEIRSVYRRWSKGINAPYEPDPVLSEIVYWNIESAIGSFCRNLDCLWVNTAEATDMHRYKGYQLKILQAAGIRIPKTLITNDPDEVIHFYETMGKNVIYKPVRGWAHTERLTDEHLTSDRLETLAKSPIKLQELIPGQDHRVYLVKDEIFAMAIQSGTLDFRENSHAPRVKTKLPDVAASECLRVAELLNLVFTGIDVRRTPDGEYVFFEANPTPVFLFDEQATGFPIGERLVDILMKGH